LGSGEGSGALLAAKGKVAGLLWELSRLKRRLSLSTGRLLELNRLASSRRATEGMAVSSEGKAESALAKDRSITGQIELGDDAEKARLQGLRLEISRFRGEIDQETGAVHQEKARIAATARDERGAERQLTEYKEKEARDGAKEDLDKAQRRRLRREQADDEAKARLDEAAVEQNDKDAERAKAQMTRYQGKLAEDERALAGALTARAEAKGRTVKAMSAGVDPVFDVAEAEAKVAALTARHAELSRTVERLRLARQSEDMRISADDDKLRGMDGQRQVDDREMDTARAKAQERARGQESLSRLASAQLRGMAMDPPALRPREARTAIAVQDRADAWAGKANDERAELIKIEGEHESLLRKERGVAADKDAANRRFSREGAELTRAIQEQDKVAAELAKARAQVEDLRRKGKALRGGVKAGERQAREADRDIEKDVQRVNKDEARLGPLGPDLEADVVHRKVAADALRVDRRGARLAKRRWEEEGKAIAQDDRAKTQDRVAEGRLRDELDDLDAKKGKEEDDLTRLRRAVSDDRDRLTRDRAKEVEAEGKLTRDEQNLARIRDVSLRDKMAREALDSARTDSQVDAARAEAERRATITLVADLKVRIQQVESKIAAIQGNTEIEKTEVSNAADVLVSESETSDDLIRRLRLCFGDKFFSN
jgi:hypothetical protein